jgi:hypothetical protein
VSDDVALFSGENSGTDWFFRQISGETSASSTGLVSTPISMIFISTDSYRREESPQLVKSRSENFENSATLNRELKNVFFSVS